MRKIILISAILLLALAVGACQPAEVEVPVVVEPTEVPPPPPEPTPAPDHSAFIAALETGPHGDNYDLGHGPNTACARCHSPQNWDPAAFKGPPPACFSCKMANDEEVRHAPGNPLVLEEDWVGIQCDTCHVLNDGIVTEGIAWLNPVKMAYEDVATSTELCEKCHVTTQGNSLYEGSGVDHKITLGGSAHLNYGGFLGETPPPTYCVDCHDPHSTEPKQCVDCHSIDEAAHAKGKYLTMKDTVTCIVCHDASGLDVGPHPDEEMGGIWTTTFSEMSRGKLKTEAVVSHSINWQVSCDRCHYEENAWELTVYTADGEIPEPPAEGD